MTTPLLELKGISKSFGATQAVNNVDLVVPRGSLIVVLGPAGAGKTTLLRLIAGLEIPDEGQVMIEGQDCTKLQPNQRDIAMIFDNLALYPNKTGFENIASPLRIAKLPKDEVNRKVEEVADMLKIKHILHRTPGTFSGGERQRVALGRAMVREPHFYLLDEPLSSLDFMLRIDLRTELKRLQKELGRTFLFATPDYTEALALADQVCVMMDGQIRQIAPAQELYDRPIDRDVARFVGNPPMNIVPARLTRTNGDAALAIGGHSMPIPNELAQKLPGSIENVEIGLRPDHVRLVTDSDASGHLSAKVNDLEPLGMHTTVGVDLEGINLVLTVEGVQEYDDGTPVEIHLDLETTLFFDPASGRLIS